ncbi:MAG: methyltransferase domain-containing protein [Gammaproteobacteria bacterium]|nr:methyltransferase domain-containing protein [Gammaproteobacteria bacterium]
MTKTVGVAGAANAARGSPAIIRRERCRLCDSNQLEPALSLTATPPANAFTTSSEAALAQQRYPLDVHRCGACGHAQLLDVVDPAALFEDYVYVSGTSPAFVAHLEAYAGRAIDTVGLVAGDHVLEIGSNDGTLLGFFKNAGMRVTGVDPARAIAESASASSIPTINGFFTESLARDIAAQHGPAKLVCANNVCAHIDNLAAVVRAVSACLSGDGQFWLEVSYLLDVVDKGLFDTIYHEHLDYHRVEPLVRFFARHDLCVWDVERIASHGGSIRVKVCRAGARQVTPAVGQCVAAEQAARLHLAEGFASWQARIDALGLALGEKLHELTGAGLRGAGYGAPAKATTLMFQFGLDASSIEYIVDDSPWKQGLYSPGIGLPVVAGDYLKSNPADFLVVLAWNFATPIIRNNAWFTERGGRFVVPLPRLEIV